MENDVLVSVKIAARDRYWPRFFLLFGGAAHLFGRVWHRYRLRGLERIPPGPVMFVGNHSGIGISDVLCMVGAWCQSFGVSRRAVGLMHDSFLAVPIVGHFARWFGAMPADYAVAQAALDEGYDLAVFPGGDLDACRPFWKAREVVFGPRRGYVRLALEKGVQIVPLATIGSHYSYLLLPISRLVGSVAHFLRLTRSHYVPLPFAWLGVVAALVGWRTFGAPWWVTLVAVGVLLVPNPVRITSEFLPALDVCAATADIADPNERVEQAHQLVHAALSDAVARMEHETPLQ